MHVIFLLLKIQRGHPNGKQVEKGSVVHVPELHWHKSRSETLG
jgi:hypothetical protein